MADLVPVCYLKVRLNCCKACPKKVHKKLMKLDGVSYVHVNVDDGFIYVVGGRDTSKLEKAVKKAIKRKPEIVSFEMQRPGQELGPTPPELAETEEGQVPGGRTRPADAGQSSRSNNNNRSTNDGNNRGDAGRRSSRSNNNNRSTNDGNNRADAGQPSGSNVIRVHDDEIEEEEESLLHRNRLRSEQSSRSNNNDRSHAGHSSGSRSNRDHAGHSSRSNNNNRTHDLTGPDRTTRQDDSSNFSHQDPPYGYYQDPSYGYYQPDRPYSYHQPDRPSYSYPHSYRNPAGEYQHDEESSHSFCTIS
ncbi:Heavy metal-associated domain, HMA [Sesbania bispinosa]|nr:Heavy metal-associated domain, HMA [Sesbania bispinosa]